MDTVDIDPNFEPQQRARSNTWPLPRPDNYSDKDDVGGGAVGGIGGMGGVAPNDPGGLQGHLPKKSSSRRNAWGNMSYADLITQAIQSSVDKRLTLSQIYDWMVQNVPYFKDKGDSNSSAGWKNSIRHNLSLHNRFMRVQNEGTGKSSWWMINPDAKPGKAARRRATSMETPKYEKKRGRVKKKVDAIRSGIDATPSPSSSISESLDMFPDSPRHHTYQLSPDFRPRASSNASSCGRLSPIPVEPDMHDSQVPPMSPGPWSNAGSQADLVGVTAVTLYSGGDRYGADQLVDTLTETMKLGSTVVIGAPSQQQTAGTPPVGSPAVSVSSPSSSSGVTTAANTSNGLKPSPPSSVGQLSPHAHLALNTANGFNGAYTASGNGGGSVTAGGTGPDGGSSVSFADFHTPYAETGKLRPLQRSPQRMMTDNGSLGVSSSYSLTNLQALSPAHSVHSMSPPQSVDVLGQSPTPPPSSQQPLFGDQQVLSPLSSQTSAYTVSPASQQSPASYCALTGHQNPDSAMLRAVLSHKEVADLTAGLHRSNSLGQNGSGAIRLAHLHHLQQHHHHHHHQQQQPHHQHGHQQHQHHHGHPHTATTVSGPSTMMGQLLAFNNCMPNDLDLNLDTLQGGLECDVDQVIRHELSVDGNLDFNFADPSSHQAAVAASNGQQWVH